MNFKDLTLLRDGAIVAFKNFPAGAKLPGMPKPLTEEEVRLLSVLDSALQVLNARGAFKEGWLEKNKIELIHPDSNPNEEDYF